MKVAKYFRIKKYEIVININGMKPWRKYLICFAGKRHVVGTDPVGHVAWSFFFVIPSSTCFYPIFEYSKVHFLIRFKWKKLVCYKIQVEENRFVLDYLETGKVSRIRSFAPVNGNYDFCISGN